MEIPECPVCLQNYDGEYTIPRVLACGHTTCESCLKNLPQKYPQTIRCPACVQLVKFPSTGPSSLPKNIDLLRLIIPTNHCHKPINQPESCDRYNQVDHMSSLLWSDELYATWKNWILEHDAVLVGGKGKDGGFLKSGNKKVGLFKVGCLSDVKASGFVSKVSYVARVMNFLYELRDVVREELSCILGIYAKNCRVCKVYGIWGDLGVGFLYLVCERLNGGFLGELNYFENGSSKDGLCSFAVVGMEIFEAIISLHLEGLFLGCLSPSCFEMDDFGHVHLSLSEVLSTGMIIHESVMEACSGRKLIGVKEIGLLLSEFFKREVFVSPEVVFEIMKKENMEVECGGSFRYSVVHSSDIWSLACIFLRLLIGRQFVKELVDCVDDSVSEVTEKSTLDSSLLCMNLMEKVSFLLKSKLGEEFEQLQQILCRCLNSDPGCRPHVLDAWKCIRELIIQPEFDPMHGLSKRINEKNNGHFLVLGELCQVPERKSGICINDEALEPEKNNGVNQELDGMIVGKDFVEGLVRGKAERKDLQGHLDCVSGLTLGGGFLFSCSFDKSVQVWSLQDLSHLHTFKGHEQKVMAVIYVDEERPLCISGDSGGGIFIWSITIPLKQEPLMKWCEEKDWRYSGIHALTTSGNGYLYTGSGDRSVKAWSLQDGTLFCKMDGHKSVVSTLTASHGVLYSGSWDGTIRLWSLTDHSPLTVLGENMPGAVTSVLSLIVEQNMLVAAYENGHIKVWRNDKFMKSMQLHNGAIFAAAMEGKYMITGGWDKTLHVQELSGDEFQVDIRSIGSIPGGAVVTSLLYRHGKLFVGHGDRTIKVYYYRGE